MTRLLEVLTVSWIPFVDKLCRDARVAQHSSQHDRSQRVTACDRLLKRARSRTFGPAIHAWLTGHNRQPRFPIVKAVIIDKCDKPVEKCRQRQTLKALTMLRCSQPVDRVSAVGISRLSEMNVLCPVSPFETEVHSLLYHPLL